MNGTHQGCPLSPIVFAMMMEPLALKIRSKAQVTGIQYGEIDHKISLHADDVILMLSNPERSLPAIYNILNNFSQIYYKIN